MNKYYITFSMATMLCLSTMTTTVQAELKLPSGADRRPNLSLDPFERARAAMRKLPSSKETSTGQVQEEPPKVIKKETTERDLTPQPIIDNNHEAPQTSSFETAFVSPSIGKAFSYEFAITTDAFSLTSGGKREDINDSTFVPRKTGIVGVVDFVAEVDTHAAGLWSNGLFFLYSSVTFGQTPDTGDLQGISNIDAGGNNTKIMELWYEHSFPYSRSSVLFGIHDFNGEFYNASYANLFVNAAFGMGMAITNGNAPTYPLTALGLRLKSSVTENSYFQIAMYDGKVNTAPNNNESSKIVSINLNKNEGVFVGTEGGIFKNTPGDTSGYYKIAVGLWYLRANQQGFNYKDNPPILADTPKPGTGGAYIFAETSIGEKMGLFFKHGRARADYLRLSQFYATGLNFTGAIPGRDEDILGIGLVHTRNSAAYLAEATDPLYKAETTYEITYTAQITSWLMVQPDFQYIQYPNMDPSIVKASVIGVRIQAVF